MHRRRPGTRAVTDTLKPARRAGWREPESRSRRSESWSLSRVRARAAGSGTGRDASGHWHRCQTPTVRVTKNAVTLGPPPAGPGPPANLKAHSCPGIDPRPRPAGRLASESRAGESLAPAESGPAAEPHWQDLLSLRPRRKAAGPAGGPARLSGKFPGRRESEGTLSPSDDWAPAAGVEVLLTGSPPGLGRVRLGVGGLPEGAAAAASLPP